MRTAGNEAGAAGKSTPGARGRGIKRRGGAAGEGGESGGLERGEAGERTNGVFPVSKDRRAEFEQWLAAKQPSQDGR